MGNREKLPKGYPEKAKTVWEEVTHHAPFKSAITEYTKADAKDKLTAEIISHVWSRMWAGWSEQIEAAGEEIQTVTVPLLEKSHEEIKTMKKAGITPLYIPPQLSTPHALPLLRMMFPSSMQTFWGERQTSWSIENIIEQHGWVYADSRTSLSRKEFFQDQESDKPREAAEVVKNKLETGELQGQTVNTYLIGSLFKWMMNGQFYDASLETAPSTHSLKASLLLGSRINYHDDISGSDGHIVYGHTLEKDPGVGDDPIKAIIRYAIDPTKTAPHALRLWGSYEAIDYGAVRTILVSEK